MSSAEGNNTEHISTREFENFREDLRDRFKEIKDEFKEVHACTERIEKKFDDFMEQAGPIFNEYRQQQKQKEVIEKKNWDLKKALIAAFLGIVGSVATTGIIVLIGIGR